MKPSGDTCLSMPIRLRSAGLAGTTAALISPMARLPQMRRGLPMFWLRMVSGGARGWAEGEFHEAMNLAALWKLPVLLAHGDVVAVVETHKGAIEIEIFEAAVIDELLAEAGQTLPVGTPLARIHPRSEEPEIASDKRPEVQDQAAKTCKTTRPGEARRRAQAQTGTPRASPSADAPPPASPAARKLADQAGVDLGAIAGTGPGGAILLTGVRVRTKRYRADDRPHEDRRPPDPMPADGHGR